MGMGLAFTDDADFSAMYNVPAAISRVIHKTYIEVNEQGTEAAAVTTVGIAETTAGTSTISIDHPFLYIIREKSSGAILFTGIVNDPSRGD
jgi:serpin B